MSATITPVAKVACNSRGRTPGSLSSVKRKPPPTLVFRYPEPDPEDPFAPLNKLRFIASNGVIGTCTEEKQEEEACPSTSLSDDEWLVSAKKDKRRSYTLYPSPPAPSVHPYASSAQHSRVTPAKDEKRTSTSAPHYRRRTHHVARTLPIGASDTASLAPSCTSVPPPLIPDDGRTSTDSSLTDHESDSSVHTKASSRLSRLLPRSKSKKRASSVKSEAGHGVSMPASRGLPVPSAHSRAASTPSSPLPSSSQHATRLDGHSSPPYSAPPSAFITVSNFSNRMAQSNGSIIPLSTTDSAESSSAPHASRLGIYRSASFKHSMTSAPDISPTPHRRNRQTSVTGVPPSLEEARKIHTLSPPKTSLDSKLRSTNSSFILVDDSSDDGLASSSQKPIDALSSPSPSGSSALPSSEELAAASSLHVVAENGIRTLFSDLLTVGKTVVIFLRHFWCSVDHAYLQSLSKELRRASLPDVTFVLIGSGSPSIIKSYRHIFQLPVQLYVDPTRNLYNALGMRTLQHTPGSTPSSPNPPAVINTGSQRKGSLKFILRAVRAGMPIWDRSGDLDQLGGEFVFEQGMKPIWAHRMAIVDGRSPAQVLIDICMPPAPPQNQPTAFGQELSLVSSDESGASSPSSPDSGFENDEEAVTFEEFFKSEKKQRDSRRVTTLHTAFAQSPTSPFRLELERIQRAESSGSDETREHNVQDGIEDCIVNARSPRELLLPMSDDEERIFMENRRRSLMRLTNKKSQRRGFIDAEGNVTHPLGEASGLSPVDERAD